MCALSPPGGVRKIEPLTKHGGDICKIRWGRRPQVDMDGTNIVHTAYISTKYQCTNIDMDGTNIVQTAYISTKYQCTNIVQQPIFVIFIVYILSEPL